jgi:hypothetical protein
MLLKLEMLKNEYKITVKEISWKVTTWKITGCFGVCNVESSGSIIS